MLNLEDGLRDVSSSFRHRIQVTLANVPFATGSVPSDIDASVEMTLKKAHFRTGKFAGCKVG